MGIIISQYKDPYKLISIMECHKGFERCSNEFHEYSWYPFNAFHSIKNIKLALQVKIRNGCVVFMWLWLTSGWVNVFQVLVKGGRRDYTIP